MNDRLSRAAAESMGITLTDVQRRAAQAVLHGRDTLLISPTGSGKSAIYQLAGKMLPGVTVVVSPLIALQIDQVQAFEDIDVGEAVAVNSARGEHERMSALRRVASGEAQFVLLGPEQLTSPEVADTLRGMTIDRFVVDEAHCIDSWGSDFRPDFLSLGRFRRSLGGPPVLALTATAAPYVRTEIVDVLDMHDPVIIVGEPERENIDIAVRRHADRSAAVDALRDSVASTAGTGLVYVGTRKETAEIAGALDTSHRPALAYHGSMPKKDRERAHAAFRGDAHVVLVATSAFGLGVDVPDVRFVHHFEAPETIDSYYQEIGRAGRDGEAAVAVLHAVAARAGPRRFAAGRSTLDAALLVRIAEMVGAANGMTVTDLAKASRSSRGRLLQAVHVLESLEVVRAGDRDVVELGTVAWAAVEERALARLEERSRVLGTRRQMMTTFLESQLCRWAMLSGYLGAASIVSCGHCDVCRAEERPREVVDATERVAHPQFGEGTVITRDADTLVVLFDHHGYRTLSRDVVEEERLLRTSGTSPTVV